MRFKLFLTVLRRLMLLIIALGLLGLGGTQAAYAQENPTSQTESPTKAEENAPPDTDEKATDDSELPEVDLEEESSSEKLSYEALTTQAAEAYRAADYAKASALFRRAYALKPVPNLLYNIGRAEEKDGNFEAAVEQYEIFVTRPGVDIKPREEALDRLRVLREVIQLNAPPEPEDTTSLDADADADTNTEDDSPGAENTPPVIQANILPPPAPRIERDYTVAWVTLSLAAASFITSGAFAWQASSAHADLDNAGSHQEMREAASWGKTSSIVADSTLGLGVILTGVGVYFIISPTEREVSDGARSGRLTPQLGPGEIGLDWAISF